MDIAGAVGAWLLAAGLLGGLTALIAGGKGYSLRTWALVGAALPVVGLVIALVVPASRTRADQPSQEALDAGRRSPVAHALHADGARTVDDLQTATDLPRRRVRLELSGLTDLALADRDGDHWSLTEHGRDALADVRPTGDPVADAVRATAAARALADGASDAGTVAAHADLTVRQAQLQLASLAGLGVVEEGVAGWRLTSRGQSLLNLT